MCIHEKKTKTIEEWGNIIMISLCKTLVIERRQKMHTQR